MVSGRQGGAQEPEHGSRAGPAPPAQPPRRAPCCIPAPSPSSELASGGSENTESREGTQLVVSPSGRLAYTLMAQGPNSHTLGLGTAPGFSAGLPNRTGLGGRGPVLTPARHPSQWKAVRESRAWGSRGPLPSGSLSPAPAKLLGLAEQVPVACPGLARHSQRPRDPENASAPASGLQPGRPPS